MIDYKQKHIDNFMRDFKDLLRRYKADYASSSDRSSSPHINFSGVPSGYDDGNVYLLHLSFDLPNNINPN